MTSKLLTKDASDVNGAEDSEAVTERSPQAAFGPWGFGDPVAAAKTFVQLSMLCVEEFRKAEAFAHQRQHATQLVTAAVSCLLLAQVERSYGAATCADVVDRSVWLRAPWMHAAATREVDNSDPLTRMACRLERVSSTVQGLEAPNEGLERQIVLELKQLFHEISGLSAN